MSVKISTGRVAESVQVIDIVFALDSHKEGFWTGAADPAKAFDGVKKVLAEKCKALGGDAVQDCQFEYRVAIAEGAFSKKQVMEIFAYGTVVKINQPLTVVNYKFGLLRYIYFFYEKVMPYFEIVLFKVRYINLYFSAWKNKDEIHKQRDNSNFQKHHFRFSTGI